MPPWQLPTVARQGLKFYLKTYWSPQFTRKWRSSLFLKVNTRPEQLNRKLNADASWRHRRDHTDRKSMTQHDQQSTCQSSALTTLTFCLLWCNWSKYFLDSQITRIYFRVYCLHSEQRLFNTISTLHLITMLVMTVPLVLVLALFSQFRCPRY